MFISLPWTNGSITLPVPAACVLFIVGMVILSQAGLWLFHRWPAHVRLEQTNEVAGIIFGTIGIIYSLILAFVIVAVWDDYNDLNKAIQTETDKLNGILAHTYALPESVREVIGKSIYNYCDQVIEQEWQMQKSYVHRPSAIPILRQALLTIPPQNENQSRVFDVIDQNLSSISDQRRSRLSHTHSQMPDLIWHVLKAGTVLLILFAYFLRVPSLKLKRIYLGFLVTAVSMCMFLIYTLDHPFDQQQGVSCEAYRTVQEETKAFLPQ